MLHHLLPNYLYFSALQFICMIKNSLSPFFIRSIFCISIFISPVFLYAQDLSSDELFSKARQTAFEQKNYPKAITICKQALIKSPDYSDIRIFMGRLYTWTDKLDSARMVFDYVLKNEAGNEDALLARASLEYWNDHVDKALNYCDTGLSYHPESTDLLLLKSKILNSLKRYQDAHSTVEKLAKLAPQNPDVRAMSQIIKDNSSKNKIGVSYDYVKFDKQFDLPWNMLSLNYSRQTDMGSVVARVNYANRFSSNGIQFETDLYPHLSKTFYCYVNAGYSSNVGVFPHYRTGFSLYANLPKSFEAEAGFRFLYFKDATWIYTLSAGKYYKNYLFTARTYLIPDLNKVSVSYSANIRYYYGGADDYVSFGAGAGLSPDESNNVLINSNKVLKAYSLSSGYNQSFNRMNILSINFNWQQQEYQLNTKGNQYNLSLGYQRRF